MSKRLRAYVEALAERHVLMAFCLLVAPETMERSPGFRFVFGIAPAIFWAALFFLVGLLAFVAKWRRSANMTRVIGVAAMMIGAVWAANFLLSYGFDHNRVSPLGAILFGYLARKDLIILSLPSSPEWDDYLDKKIAQHESASTAP